MKTMKILLAIYLTVFFVNAYACDKREPTKSNFIIETDSTTIDQASCIRYRILFHKSTGDNANLYLDSAAIKIAAKNGKTIYSSALELQDVSSDTYLASFCIDEKYTATSSITLWLTYPKPVKLVENNTLSIISMGCHDEEIISVSDLAKYNKGKK